MTTVQTMLARAGARVRAGATLLLVCAVGLAACQRPQLAQPAVLVSPYEPAQGEVRWAIAPLANESGVSRVDVLTISDKLVAAIEEVKGISCVPVNRTLAAMDARGVRAIRTPQDAKAVAEALGVRGLVLGTITAYDPYTPPKFGLTLALYWVDAAGPADSNLDPRALQAAYSDRSTLPHTRFRERPASVVSEHLDAANNEVLKNLQDFAVGRSDPDSALGWQRYTASMDLYTEFAAYWCVRRLLEEEHARIAPPPETAETPKDSKGQKNKPLR